MNRFSGLERVAREISRDLEAEFNSIGIFFRIFYRVKSRNSIEQKRSRKKYSSGGNLLQDLIGIRVIVYFADDVYLVKEILKGKVNFENEASDTQEETEFGPVRNNYVFRFNEDHKREVKLTLGDGYEFIDSTFEVQIRTILSEGWHEIEHDFRYKRSEDWHMYNDLSRTFNGVLATLETSDWTTLRIFEELAQRHYKHNHWISMFMLKFRLRIEDQEIDNSIVEIIEANADIAKEYFMFDRLEFLIAFYRSNIKVPLSLNNMLYLVNHFSLKRKEISNIIPPIFLESYL